MKSGSGTREELWLQAEKKNWLVEKEERRGRKTNGSKQQRFPSF